jgi:hypothetical protein
VLLALVAAGRAAPTPEGSGPIKPAEKVARPVRVLLWSGAASREHQLLTSLLAREAEARRVELSVCLQPPPGKAERKRAVEGVPPARSLTRFPDELSAEVPADPAGRAFDLASYEVVVAVDPDWSRLSEDQAKKLGRWVQKNGGGLVVVAGALNTAQLAGNDAKLKAVRGLLPVVVAEGKEDKRDTSRPWALNFPKGKPRPAYLRLDADGKGPLAGWADFFHKDKDSGAAERGFYSCHPVESVRPGAVLLATFGDPKARSPRGQERPYLASLRVGAGRVAYLGSGEAWRLAAHKRAFYERFWTGLIAEAAGRP